MICCFHPLNETRGSDQSRLKNGKSEGRVLVQFSDSTHGRTIIRCKIKLSTRMINRLCTHAHRCFQLQNSLSVMEVIKQERMITVQAAHFMLGPSFSPKFVLFSTGAEELWVRSVGAERELSLCGDWVG